MSRPRKNILFLSTRFPYPPVGGHYLRTFNIIRILANRYNVHLVSFANVDVSSEQQLLYEKKMQEYCCSCATFTLPEDIDKKYLFWNAFVNIFEEKPFIVRKYYKKSLVSWLKKFLSEQAIDLIHLDMLPLAEYTYLFRKYCSGVPIVLTDHNVEYLRMLRRSQIETAVIKRKYCGLQSEKTKKFEKKAIAAVDLCVVVSEADRKFLKELNGGKAEIIVIPNGVDTNYFKSVTFESDDNGQLLWVGGMADVYNKNAVEKFLSEIFPHIIAMRPTTVFKIVGQKPSWKIKQMASSDHRIQILGFVEDILPVMSEANVFVAPIYAGSGTKIKILNAMSMGKAIVTTDIGIEGISAINGRDLLVENDSRKFADKVLYLLRNPEERHKLGLNARKVVEEKYSWPVIGDRLINTYEELIR